MTVRVLVVGGAGEFDLSSSYMRGFSQAGADAHVFPYYGILSKALRVPQRAGYFGAQIALRRWAALLLVQATRRHRPDLVFFTKCDCLPAWTYPAIRQASPGTRLAAFHPDDPFIRHWYRGPAHRRSMTQARAMDQYYVWSERLVEKVRAEGITHVQYLGFGADPHFSFPVPLSDQDRARFGASVSFVGNWDDKRERWLQPIVASGIDVAIWGTNYWGTRARDPRIRNAWRGSTAMGTDMVKAATAAALSINILREQNEGGENMRTYELPACGALMLAEYSSPQAAAFPEGESAYYARTAEEMAAKAREISEMAAADREAVRRRAVEAARTQTYGHRARRVLDTTLGRG